MPKTWEDAKDLEHIASGLISGYHPEISTARILYCFVSEAGSKGGRKIPGKVRKFSGFMEWVLNKDFVVEVALDMWLEFDQQQKTALVDHLLERCYGEENEDSGEISWKLREPDVQEFGTILNRHGAWNSDLHTFVSISREVDLDQIIEEEGQVDQLEEETVQVENER
jgi:hypothetical protein